MEKELDALQQLIDTVVEFSVNYSFSVFGAVVVLVIGFIVAHQVAGVTLKLLTKKNLDITLSKFIAGFIRVIILGFAVLIALGKFGITIAPFVAAIGAMAFGASFAFQGPLANFGAGLIIVMTRPFVVGDTITIQEQSGVVEVVKMGATTLSTEDGVKVTIPNKFIVGEILHNSKNYRIIETTVGISYSDDPEKAIAAIQKVLASFSEVTQDPKPQVGVNDFGDSSVNIGLRYWVPTQAYFHTLYAVNLAVFKALADAKISIPFPQRDVHVVSEVKTTTV